VSADRLTAAAGPGLPVTGDATATSDADRARIAQAAKQFESMFLLQMLKQMRQSMLSDENEEPGFGAGTMFETIDAKLSEYLAGQRGGLAPTLIDAMTKASAPTGGPGVPGAVSTLGTLAAPALPVNQPAAALPLPAGRGAAPGQVKGTTGRPMVSGTQASAADVTSSFGWRKDPFSGAAKFHSGVDIRAAYGREVMTAGAGRVVSAGVQGGYGQSVVIEHAPGLRTRYAHLSSIDVTPGQVLDGGSVVGKVGQSGRATGPHLHFEVLANGKAVNPEAGGRLLAAALKESAAPADYPSGSAGTRVTLSGAEE
jgi:murein DD-endopeptidase MepM/ murein hydrolase activator NlpD